MKKIIDKIRYLINSKNYPHITYDAYTEKRLSESCVGDKTANEYLGLILSKLGLKSEDQIWICNFETVNSRIGYCYSVNCYQNNKYLFSLGYDYEELFDRNPKLIIANIDKKTKYKYEMSYSIRDGKENISLTPVSYQKEFQDGTKCCITYYSDAAQYKITNGTNEFVLKITKKINICSIDKDEYGIDKKYELNNEDKLINYLVSLKFPILIDEVYKKICEISLGNDVSEYDFIHIYALKEGKQTDFIEISRGEWQRFGRTQNGKTIVIHQNGYWSYKLSDTSSIDVKDEQEIDSTAKFSMSFGATGFDYKVSAKSEGEIDGYTQTLAMYDISTARSEVEETKKLVRELVKNKQVQ